MNSGDYKYVWQAGDWPHWRYDLPVLAGPMMEVSRAQGLLLGRLTDVGMALRDRASLSALTEDVVRTTSSTSFRRGREPRNDLVPGAEQRVHCRLNNSPKAEIEQ